MRENNNECVKCVDLLIFYTFRNHSKNKENNEECHVIFTDNKSMSDCRDHTSGGYHGN